LTITNEKIAVDLSKYSSQMDLSELFGNDNSIHLEVGSGKGTFLVNQAGLHPQFNYLGIEWANKYYRYSVDRVRRWQLTNVRILRTDVRQFIKHYLRDNSVAAFHIYFPDPWPKKRHQKRRFFTPENLLEVARCLIPSGQLRIATDYAEYFEVIQHLLLHQPETAKLFEQEQFFPGPAAQKDEWVGTNFERKYIKQGRQIYTLAMRNVK